jgi:acetylornithine deacetylase
VTPEADHKAVHKPALETTRKLAQELAPAAIELLKRLIALPSFSREEDKTADALQEFLHERGIPTERHGNNVWSCNADYDASKPTLLLNSHHDTVRANADWTLNPHEPLEIKDSHGTRLHGLGSNDAGGALVSLVSVFAQHYRSALAYNLVLAASAEEEIIGRGGIESVLPQLGKLDMAIVGEPTGAYEGSDAGADVSADAGEFIIRVATAEKGLLVLDCTAQGRSGHAARDVGVNAISEAMRDIAWFHSFQFPKISAQLGAVKMSVTMISAGTQHNMIPDQCSFVVDVRTTDAYTNEETLALIQQHVGSRVQARSTRLRPSSIALDHPLVQAASSLGLQMFASPTMSDQTVIPVPSVKFGPGRSERSHTADEFIYLHEIETGIATYLALLERLRI